MKRALLTIIGIVLFLFLGLIYAWSIFVAPLESEFLWSRAQTSLVFTICMSAFCVGGFASAQLRKKIKPSYIIIISGIIIAAGFFMVSNTHKLWQLYVFYGVFCGFAVGCAYNCLISVIPLHYPKHIGMINGILLMFFGFGSMVLGPIVTKQMNLYGWRHLFQSLSIVFLIIFVVASFFQKMPERNLNNGNISGNTDKGIEPREMLRKRSFWLFFIWQVAVGAIGLTSIGHAASIAKDVHIAVGILPYVVGSVGAASGLGKLSSGILSDKLGEIKTAFIMTVIGFVGCFLLIFCIKSGTIVLLILGFISVGFCYGGAPTLNAAFVRKQYGNKYFPSNFSLMTFSLILSAIFGTYIVGIVRSNSVNYMSSIMLMIVYMIIGLIALLYTSKTIKKQD